MNPEYSTRNLVPEVIKAKLTQEASERQTQNYYGWVPEGSTRVDQVRTSSYVCYAYLSSAGRNIPAFFGAAAYSSSYGSAWPFEEQNLYFEYVLDPKRSPWKMLLAELDYEVCRDNTGIITGLIIYSTKVNRYILFQFMKSLRQVIERAGGIKVFTDSVKGRYKPEEPDKEYSEAQENFLLDAFYLSQMFNGSGVSIHLDWGHEHKNFHGFPSKMMFDREIRNFKKLSENTYFQDSGFQSGIELHNYAFGQAPGNKAQEFLPYSGVISQLIKNKKEVKEVVGNLFNKPTASTVSGNGTKYFKLSDILALVPAIGRDLRSKAK